MRARNAGLLRAALMLVLGAVSAAAAGLAAEPPALNPFGPVQTERDDSVPGYVEMSDGTIYAGNVYMTRDKRLKMYDATTKRQREIPLRVVKQIDAKVTKEWMEKEWRFKELALDEKYYTGRTYPVREFLHTVTLQDDRTITGPLAEILYVAPYSQSAAGPLTQGKPAAPERVMLHKDYKGQPGKDLKSLVYVKVVKLGEDALAEGQKKTSGRRPAAGAGAVRGATSRQP